MVSHSCKHIDQHLADSGSLGVGGGAGGGVCDLLKLEPRHEIPMASYSSKPMGLPLAAAASLWVGASGSFWEPPRGSERGVVRFLELTPKIFC